MIRPMTEPFTNPNRRGTSPFGRGDTKPDSKTRPSALSSHRQSLPVRVFLVDDQLIVRKGLKMLLALEPDISVCGDAADGPSAMEDMEALRPDLAVVDLSLEVGDGFELIEWSRRRMPEVKIVVFTMHDEISFVERAIRCGAHGYLIKQDGPQNVVKAIRSVMKGGRFIRIGARAKNSGSSA